jgi:hypothetical protein
MICKSSHAPAGSRDSRRSLPALVMVFFAVLFAVSVYSVPAVAQDASPQITSIRPAISRTSGGGHTIALDGTNLSGATSVTFGGVPATLDFGSDTYLNVVVPPHPAGVVDVVVTTPEGSSIGFPFTYDDGLPTVSINAPSVVMEGDSGTKMLNMLIVLDRIANDDVLMDIVVVAGTATEGTDYRAPQLFARPISAGLPNRAYTVEIIGDTEIEDDETFHVELKNVVNANVGPRATISILNDDFATPTITSMSPASGPAAGGSTITITGTGFTGATAVSFGGTAAATYTVDSATQISAVSPPGTPGDVDVEIVTPGGNAISATRFNYAAPGRTVAWTSSSAYSEITASAGGGLVENGGSVPSGSIVEFVVKPRAQQTYESTPTGCGVQYVSSSGAGDLWRSEPVTADCSVSFSIRWIGIIPSTSPPSSQYVVSVSSKSFRHMWGSAHSPTGPGPRSMPWQTLRSIRLPA